MKTTRCKSCWQTFAISLDRCPHCGLPGLFPNVAMNSVLFMEHHQIPMSQAHELPRGHRATWTERSKLCVAKLAAKIDGQIPEDGFPGLLLRQGKTLEDDDFVEVHIGGPMTIRTLERVIVMKGSQRRRRAIARALEARLGKLGVTLES